MMSDFLGSYQDTNIFFFHMKIEISWSLTIEYLLSDKLICLPWYCMSVVWKKGVTESYSFQDQLWSHKWDFMTHCIPSKFKYTNQIRLLQCYSQNPTQSSLNHKQIPVEFDLWLCLKFLKSLTTTPINYMVQRKKNILWNHLEPDRNLAFLNTY